MSDRVVLVFVLTAALFVGVLLLQSAPGADMDRGFLADVTGVIEGDQLEIMREGITTRLRLYGIDCPETDQPFGREAKDYVATRVFGKKITVIDYRWDGKSRVLGEVILPDGTNLGRDLLRSGLAWYYRPLAKRPERDMRNLQRAARREKKGLWAEEHPTPPWTFRKQDKNNRHDEVMRQPGATPP